MRTVEDTIEERAPAARHGRIANTPIGDFLHAASEAAVAAELETGTREIDRAAAKAHIVIRALRGIAGLLIIVVGVALLVLPGPGALLVLAGLGLLAIDYPFAARLRDRLLHTGGRYAGRAGRILKGFLVAFGVTVFALLALGALTVILLLNALS